MTRLRKNAGTSGRIVFVGAGPGDPGMLTARATAALAEAGVVLVDPGVSAGVQDAHTSLFTTKIKGSAT